MTDEMRLLMGKMKIGIYCYFIADSLTKVFLEMFLEWSSTKLNILYVLSKPLNLTAFDLFNRFRSALVDCHWQNIVYRP